MQLLRLWSTRALTPVFFAGVAGLLVHTAWVAGLGKGELDELIDSWIYNGVLLCCAVACLLRGAVAPAERLTWLCFGVGLLAWTAGDIYWTAELAGLKQPPYPSPSDLGYLLTYPFMYVGVALLVRRGVRLNSSAWLDGMIGGLAAAALATAILAPAFVDLTKGDAAVVATNLAYPLGDVLLLSFLVAGVTLSGARVSRALWLVGGGILTWGIADAVYLYQTATGVYDGGYLDSLWLGGGLLIALAALSVSEQPPERARINSILFPSVFALLALAVLAWDHFEALRGISFWLACGTLLAVVVRLVLTFRENASLLRTVHTDAVTDALTGLANRRSVMAALSRATRGPDPFVFAIFDLDGFKAYNDAFGHPAGDMLLRRVGGSLADTADAAGGSAYRLGGDEFCVLVPGGQERVADVLASSIEALSERGEGFRITASAGAAVVPFEASSPAEALGLADMRMYAAKGTRPRSAQRQTHDVLVRALREREPALSAHLAGVTLLAAEMGKRLGLEAEELDVLVRAAELHDIGKLAIPDRVLHKPGPLDPAEWDLIHTHTLIGQRILAAAPAMSSVAELVRASHERWDGKGYPSQLRGEAIPLGARVIFVCDAYEAMTHDRSYRRARTSAEAVAELRRGAGAQFDPKMVAIFVERVLPELEGSTGGAPQREPAQAQASKP